MSDLLHSDSVVMTVTVGRIAGVILVVAIKLII